MVLTPRVCCVRKIIRRVSHCVFLPYIGVYTPRRSFPCRFSVIFLVFSFCAFLSMFSPHVSDDRFGKARPPFTTPVVSSPPDTCFMLWRFYRSQRRLFPFKCRIPISRVQSVVRVVFIIIIIIICPCCVHALGQAVVVGKNSK